MSSQRDWEKFKHIRTLYLCKYCKREVAFKNGDEKKSHICGSAVRENCRASSTPVPFCIICMGMLSLKPQKMEKHYKYHSALFNKEFAGAYPRVSFELLFSDFGYTVSSNNIDFLRSNEAVRKNLTEIISRRFPKVKVYIYGSREIGTGTQSSDLDIYVDTDQSYHIYGLNKTVMKTLKEAAVMLKENPDVWDNINVIVAKPIIKVYNKIEKISCDLSFSDGLGHSNTQLIKKLCDRLPIFRNMIIFLGQWLDKTKLSDHINKYTLRLLIMNYLQCEGLLPSIKAMQDDISNPAKIGAWNVDYDETKISHLITNKVDDLKEHIKGFFKLQGKAKRFNGIISIYLGKTIERDNFHLKMPQNYAEFIDKYKDQEFVISGMNVQGPFNLADNPAKKVSKNHRKKFVHFSKVAYAFLTK